MGSPGQVHNAGAIRDPKDGAVGGGVPHAWSSGGRWRPLPGGDLSLAGQVGRTPETQPDITMQPQAPIAGLGWQHRQKHQHPRAGRVSFPTETCKQRGSCSILFPQDSSERNRPGCYSRGSFFCFSCFFFSWKFESTTLSPIIRYFSKENNSHQQAKRILWLAGLAPGFGRLASARISAFFLGLEQALAFLPASFQDFS